MTKDRGWTRWALFVALLITIPVPYYMVVVGGLVPFFFIFFLALQGLIVSLPKFTAEGFWILAILWTHVVILGGLLFLGASGIHLLLFRILPRQHAKFVVFALITVLILWASIFDIYRAPGHNHAPPANLLRFIREFAI